MNHFKTPLSLSHILFPFFLALLYSCNDSGKVDTFCKNLNLLLIQKDVVRSNIMNINTTRTPEGGVYKPLIIKKCSDISCEIIPSNNPPIFKYEKNHPDANSQGYVSYPNIILEEENLKLEKIELAISFLLKSMPVDSTFFFSEKGKVCFDKYPMLDKEMNFHRLLIEGK